MALETQRQVSEWVYPLDTAKYHKETLKKTKAREGTCKWLFDSPEYKVWLQLDQKTLWCSGIRKSPHNLYRSIRLALVSRWLTYSLKLVPVRPCSRRSPGALSDLC